MASRDLTPDQVAEELEKQEKDFGEGDIDDNFENSEIDKKGEELIGNSLPYTAEVGSIYKEAEKDDRNRGDIAPDGSDAQEDEE